MARVKAAGAREWTSSDLASASTQAWVVGAAALWLILVLLPCFVPVSPVAYFDVDPRGPTGGSPVTSITPAGAAWLHVLGVLIGGGCVAVSVAAGGRVRPVMCGLFLFGAAFAAWHMGSSYEDLQQGGAWIAGGALGVGAAHVGRHDAARRVMVAGLIAALVPMALHAMSYVFFEHPATVEMYLQNEAETLRSRGWAEGSPQHILYKRRLTDASAVGAFGLSNVFGSVVAAATVMALAVAHGVFWGTKHTGTEVPEPAGARAARALWAGGPAVLGVVTLGLTQSKGVALGFLAGCGLLVVVIGVRWWVGRVRPASTQAWGEARGGGGAGGAHMPAEAGTPRGAGWVVAGCAVAGVLGAVGVVLVRGAMGPPETWEGERSLLFRWQYWQAALAMLGDAPWRIVTGVGVDGFRALYAFYKNPLNPEDVTSSHNVFVDWVTMLGLGGVAWVAMVLGWLISGARGAVAERVASGSAEGATGERWPLWVVLSVVTVVYLVKLVVTFPIWVLLEHLVANVVGCIAMVGVGAAVITALRWRGAAVWAAVAAFVAGVTLIIHNQIEMSFFHFGSIWVVTGIVGLGGAGRTVAEPASTQALSEGVRSGGGLHGRRLGWGVVGVMVVGAGVMGAVYARAVTVHEGELAAAARLLREGRIGQAIAALDRAAEAVPRDTQTRRWRIGLRLEWAEALAGSGMAGGVEQARKLYGEAEGVAGEDGGAGDMSAEADTPGTRTPVDRGALRQGAAVAESAARVLKEPARLKEAIALRERGLGPFSLPDHVQLAELYWQTGDRERAKAMYRRALELNEQSYLDPGKQLSERERGEIERRVRE